VNQPFRIAVIGGGISGLAAAYRLREIAATREIPLHVTLYERGEALGGALRTVRRDGFVMEAGADSFLTEKPWARELAERIGLGAELIPTREEFRKTCVVRCGRLVEIPAGFSLLAPARLGPVFSSPLFTPWAKLRIAMEPLIPSRREAIDESLASFVTRRLGREVLDRLAQPLASGIYTADPERLSMQATMPRFVEMERRHGSVIRGLRAAEHSREAMKNTSGARWSLFLSLRAGVGSLAEALVARLEGSIKRGSEVTSLARDGARWRIAFADGANDSFDAIVCAAPAFAAAKLTAASIRSSPRCSPRFGTHRRRLLIWRFARAIFRRRRAASASSSRLPNGAASSRGVSPASSSLAARPRDTWSYARSSAESCKAT